MSTQRHEAAVGNSAGARGAPMSITSRNDLQSPLLRLPGEIRNRIYTYVFTSTPHKMYYSEHIGHYLRVHIQDRPAGIDLTRVCRKLHHETALLPFFLNEIQCVDINVLTGLHILLQPAQRMVIRNLTIEAKIDDGFSVANFLREAREHKILLSYYYPNLERVVVAGHFLGSHPSNMQIQRHGNSHRLVRIIGSKHCLKEWLCEGAKEGFQVVFEDHIMENPGVTFLEARSFTKTESIHNVVA